MYVPFNYADININNNRTYPSTIKHRQNRSFAYWERALFQRAVSVFEWDLPESWTHEAKDFFLYCLYRYGYVAVFNHPKYGFTFQPCTFGGERDWYYQPTKAIVANPKLNDSLILELGKDAELIKLTPDFMGAWDVVNFYASQLAEITADVEMSLVNNKVPFAVGVRNKTAREIVKKAFDLIQRGEPAVVADMRLLKDKTDDEEAIHILDRNLASSYITDKLLSDMRTIMSNFNTEVGIPNVAFEKKERLTNDEVNANNVETVARITTWYDTINRSLDNVARLFPNEEKIVCIMRGYNTVDEDGNRTDESEVDS